jgi:hypothetical protein
MMLRKSIWFVQMRAWKLVWSYSQRLLAGLLRSTLSRVPPIAVTA